ncbi:MAG: acylphosphatase [Flavobacteriales bacterium]|nr:acylphosphatase [Flavobacteriales bacterium]
MIHYNITFKVQEVWYRKFTKTQADLIGLTGFSLNQTDGSVYAEVEGTEDQIATFIAR